MAKENNTLKRADFNYKFAILTIYAKLRGIKFICTSYTRTAEEQNRLFKEGKSQCDGYKKISMHQKDRARDIVIITDKAKPIWKRTEDYETLGKFWVGLDGVWGGNFKSINDPYHFEY